MTNAVQESGSAREPKRQRRQLGLSFYIMAALVGGIAFGLMFGEYAGGLSFIGDVYVGLLQMTVLPYIICTVIGTIGRLSFGEGKRLMITGACVQALLWGIGLAAVWLLPLSLPYWKSGAFFSTSLLEPVKEVDFYSLFVPANPFFSLSSNSAPAVVLFCLFFGFALIHVKNKEDLLGLFDIANVTLSRVNSFIVQLSPIGIFAISASASGTLTLEEFGRLQAYFIVYFGGVGLITFWVLPMLVASLTPMRYVDIMRAWGNVLITAFVVGSVFVVIPMLVDSVKELLEKYRKEGDPDPASLTYANPAFILPLAYPFPHLGKIVTLIFVPFAAWFYGQPIVFYDYPAMLLTGLFLSFGKVTVTVPFLLDMQEIPSDIFQLFLLSGVVAGRLNDLLGAAHLLTFTILTICAMTGMLAVQRFKLVWSSAAAVVVAGLMIVATQVALSYAYKGSLARDEILASMHAQQEQAPAKIHNYGEPNPVALEPGMSRIERMEQTGTLRIGFNPDNQPYSFYNTKGDLVGLDIDMAHRLARDTGRKIDFVPFWPATVGEQLLADHFDIAMSGIGLTVTRASRVLSTTSYMNVTMALVVRDHDKRELQSITGLQNRKPLTIGVEVDSFFADQIERLVPEAKIVKLWSASQFFEGPPQYMDALVTSAEAGSAWTLSYPEYAVTSPFRRKSSVPLVYLIAGADEQTEDFFQQWILLKKQDGTIDRLYDYWILGRGAEIKTPRWSIIRDVLHWID